MDVVPTPDTSCPAVARTGIWMEFPADAAFLAPARAFVAAAGVRAGLEPLAVHALQMAADEACANAIQHGSPDPDARVELRVATRADRIEVDIIDHGPGFRPENHASIDVISILRDMPDRGLGLSIIRALADRFEYLPGQGGGNVVRITLRLSTPRRTV